MDWFYDKEINIYTNKDYEDEHGITRNGYIKATKEPYLVDIQPYSTEKAKKDYGYDIKCTRRMFSDAYSEITEDCIVEYNNKYYKIEAIPWDDDYLEVLLSETKGVNIIETEVENNAEL
ncbi:UNVERIFIED_ORG: hypothetical protein B2H98_05290 [Clostridium botulinum]